MGIWGAAGGLPLLPAQQNLLCQRLWQRQLQCVSRLPGWLMQASCGLRAEPGSSSVYGSLTPPTPSLAWLALRTLCPPGSFRLQSAPQGRIKPRVLLSWATQNVLVAFKEAAGGGGIPAHSCPSPGAGLDLAMLPGGGVSPHPQGRAGPCPCHPFSSSHFHGSHSHGGRGHRDLSPPLSPSPWPVSPSARGGQKRREKVLHW